MKCPWCDKRVDVPENAFTNVEYYGSSSFLFKHKCGNNIRIYIERITRLSGSVQKADNSDDNYSYGSNPI